MELTRGLRKKKRNHNAKEREISELLWHQEQYFFIVSEYTQIISHIKNKYGTYKFISNHTVEW